MCEACNKAIYFDKSWSFTDCGYGDTDYGGVAKNQILNLLICPVCGKLKTTAISQFGSIEKALIYLYTINLPEMFDKSSIISKFTEELDLVGINMLEQILSNQGLQLNDGKLVHSCGHVIFSGIKNVTHYSKISDILEKKNIKFCPACGKKILPFNININPTVKVISTEVSREKTWDRGE